MMEQLLKEYSPPTSPWGSNECVVCNQGEEIIQDFRRRNVLYETDAQLVMLGVAKMTQSCQGQEEQYMLESHPAACMRGPKNMKGWRD